VLLDPERDQRQSRAQKVTVGERTRPHGYSVWASLAAEGRYVSFTSSASNLVRGDTNRVDDACLHDRIVGSTIKVRVSSTGGESTSKSATGSVSADGRFTAFSTQAPTLVPGDTNGSWDVFVHDRGTRATSRVSVASDGGEADADSSGGALSADGRYIAFQSESSNLIANDANDASDIFVHDRVSGTTTRVSVDSSGVDGRPRATSVERARIRDRDPRAGWLPAHPLLPPARAARGRPGGRGVVPDVVRRPRSTATSGGSGERLTGHVGEV
jgi:Tol biopolymer transport system component